MSYDAGSVVATLTLDRTPFQQGIDEARGEVRRLEAEDHAVRLTVDSANATATIDGLREKLTRLSSDSARIAVTVDSASADAQIEHIREQFARLGMDTARLRIDVATAGASSAIADVESRLDRLASRVVRPRIEIDTAGLDATLLDVFDRLERIDRFRATPHVDLTGAAETAAQLASIDAQLRGLSNANANIGINADTGSASSSLSGVSGMLSRLAGIGKITVVVEAVVAGAGALGVLLGQLGALGGAAAAGGAATGLVGLAGRSILSPVLNNFKQIGQASGGTGGGAGSSQANAVASAQEAVGVAQQKSADDQVDSARKISDAQRSLGDAYRQAAQSAQQAADTVHSAEETLTTAQQAETTAQQALSQARRDAARQLEDYNLQLEQSTTNQAQATFAVTDAQKALTTLVNQRQQGDTRITAEDISKAQLAVDAAKENLKGLQTAGSRLQADAAVAAQKGVEGSTAVVAAKQAESAAVQAVTDDQHKLTEAIQAQGQAQKDSAEKIATAQEAVATAQLDASRQARDDARSVADAQRALAQAMRAQGAAAGGAASGLKKLDAAQQGLLNSMLALKAQATSLFKTVEPQIIGAAHNIVNGLSDALRTFTPALAPAANALEQVSQGFQRAMSGPAAQRFSAFMTTQGPTAIRIFSTSAANLGSGILNIFEAFTPLISGVEKSLQGATDKFKQFTLGLPNNPAFKQFLQFVKDNAPLVGKILKDALGTLGQIFQALEPAIPPVLKLLDALVLGLRPLAKPVADLVTAIANGLLPVVQPLSDGLAGLIKGVTPLIKPIGDLLAAIVAGLSNIFNSPGFSAFTQGLASAIEDIAKAVSRFVNSKGFDAFINGLLNAAGAAVKFFGELVANPGVIDALTSALMAMTPFLAALPQIFQDLTPLIGPLTTALTQQATFITDVVAPALKLFTDVALGAIGHLASGLGSVLQHIPGLGGLGRALKTAGNDILGIRNTIDKASNDMKNSLANKPAAGAAAALAALRASAPKFAQTSQTLADTVTAALSRGANQSAEQGAKAGLGYAQALYKQSPTAQNRAQLLIAQTIYAMTLKSVEAGGSGTALGRHYINAIAALRGQSSAAGSAHGNAAVAGMNGAQGGAGAAGSRTGAHFASGVAIQVGATQNAANAHKNIIAQVFQDAPNFLYNAGKYIIQGLIQGIGSLAQSAFDSVKNLAGGLVSSALGALGINSPSKVFHGIGQSVGEGLVNGLTSMHSTVAGAAAKLANAAVINPAVLTTAAAVAGQSGISGGSSKLNRLSSSDMTAMKAASPGSHGGAPNGTGGRVTFAPTFTYAGPLTPQVVAEAQRLADWHLGS